MRSILTKTVCVFCISFPPSGYAQEEQISSKASRMNSVLFSNSTDYRGIEFSIQLICEKKSNLKAVSVVIENTSIKKIFRIVTDTDGIAKFKHPREVFRTNTMLIKIGKWSQEIRTDDNRIVLNLPNEVCEQLRSQKKGIATKPN